MQTEDPNKKSALRIPPRLDFAGSSFFLFLVLLFGGWEYQLSPKPQIILLSFFEDTLSRAKDVDNYRIKYRIANTNKNAGFRPGFLLAFLFGKTLNFLIFFDNIFKEFLIL